MFKHKKEKDEILERIEDLIGNYRHDINYQYNRQYETLKYTAFQLIKDLQQEQEIINNFLNIVNSEKMYDSEKEKKILGILEGVKNNHIIKKQNKRYQIFISSTYKDLISYRSAVADSVSFSNNIPAGMENFKASSQNPTEYIKKVIDNSDYYILILGQRYGSIQDEEKQISFTEMEYNYAKSQRKIIIPFMYIGEQSLPNSDLDINKEKFLLFKKKISKDFMMGEFDSTESLKYRVLQAINDEIKNHPQKGWIRL